MLDVGYVVRRLQASLYARLFPGRNKGLHELLYWEGRQRQEGTLGNAHYEAALTRLFGLERSFYAGARILDVGCGPRGSLEWASQASLRVGLDPLAAPYRRLGTRRHGMSYVAASAETMPFRDGSFDVVSSINSLDHVDDPDAVIAEITRVLRIGGTLLILSEVGHPPTPTEPQTFFWDVLDRFPPRTRVIDVKRLAQSGNGVYGSAAAGTPYREGSGEPGVLQARLERVH